MKKNDADKLNTKKEKSKCISKGGVLVYFITDFLLLVLSLVFSTALIYLLLLVLFKLAPESAYTCIDADNVKSITNVKANSLNGTINTDRVYFDINEESVIGLSVCKIQYMDTIYDDIYNIRVVPLEMDPNKPKISVVFGSYGNDEFFDVEHRGTHMESIEISANPVIFNHGEIIPDEVFKEERVTIDHLSNNFSITSKYGISLYLDHPVDMTCGFDDSEVYLIRRSGEEIKVQSSFYIQSSYISCSDYYQNYTDKYVSISIPEFADQFNYLPYSIDLNLNHVSHAEARASGDVYFSYTPNGKEYELRDQNIQVSGKNELEMSLHYDNKSVEESFFRINGSVNECKISDMSLVPTFKGWFRENVLLAPLALVSALLGAISIKPKKFKDNKSEASE